MLVLMAFVLSMAGPGSGTLASTPQDSARMSVERGPDPRRWAYDHVSVDCERIVQLHGRNGAWGRWELPLAAISGGDVLTGSARPAEEAHGDGAMTSFRCTDGSDCIGVGRVDQATPQQSEHSFGFADAGYARRFLSDLERFRASCAAAGGSSGAGGR